MGNLSALGNTVVQTTPVGVIEAFAGVNAPAGWLFCDGSAISRTQYPELFSALSTTYGSGDGSTTFNIPDLRGRVPAGKDNMGGVAANRLTSGNSGITATSLGANGGDERLHQHTHTQNAHGHTVTNIKWTGSSHTHQNTGGYFAEAPWPAGGDATPAGVPATTATNQNTGSGNSQNVQPTLIVNYIIKAVADLPRGGWFYQNQPSVVTQLPSNPQIGQEVYYYITSPYAGYQRQRWDGNAWTILSDSRASGAWQSWSPTISQNNVSIAYTSGRGRYLINGKMVTAMFGCYINGSGTSGFTINFTLPTPAFTGLSSLYGRVGTFHYYRAATGFRYTGILEMIGTNTAVMVSEETGGNGLGASPAFAAAVNDQAAITMTYEVD